MSICLAKDEREEIPAPMNLFLLVKGQGNSK